MSNWKNNQSVDHVFGSYDSAIVANFGSFKLEMCEYLHHYSLTYTIVSVFRLIVRHIWLVEELASRLVT